MSASFNMNFLNVDMTTLQQQYGVKVLALFEDLTRLHDSFSASTVMFDAIIKDYYDDKLAGQQASAALTVLIERLGMESGMLSRAMSSSMQLDRLAFDYLDRLQKINKRMTSSAVDIKQAIDRHLELNRRIDRLTDIINNWPEFTRSTTANH